MRLLLLLVLAIDFAYCTCPTGFDLINGQECRGNYTRATESKVAALTKCNEILGNVPIIHSQQDQNDWANRVKKSDMNWTTFGLSCDSTSRKWVWIDGTPLDYKPPSYDSDLDGECSPGLQGSMRNSDGYWTYSPQPDTVDTRDIFCSMPLRQPINSGDGCDSFEEDNEDGVCYQIAAPAESWKESQIICGKFGGIVASVHNTQENAFIRRLAVSKGATGGLFLGAAPTGKGNEFEWVDGSKWDYDNFYPGFPMKGMGDCLMMDTAASTGNWANVDCSTKLAVVCERDKNYKLPVCEDGNWVEGQIIMSPGFPYDASTPCNFLLTVDPGKKVELEIILLEANPCCDQLIVYENYFGADVIANLTGIYNGTTYTTTSSNFMRVMWQPTWAQNVKGVMFTYRAV